MIYVIVLCAAGLHGQCVSGLTPMGPTFDSSQACLAALPAMLNGRTVSADGRLYATDTTWYACVDGSGQPVQPQAAASPPKRYVIAMCFETEALAKAANPGNWKPGDSCIQMMPGALPEDGLDCLAELAQAAPSKSYDLVAVIGAKGGRIARYYRHGERDVWLQCYETAP